MILFFAAAGPSAPSPFANFARYVTAAAAFFLSCLPYHSSRAMEKQVSLITGKPMGDLAVAGRLSVDLHGEFMASRSYDKDTVLNWYNCGYSGGGRGTSVGGNFGDFGFQVPWQERDTKYPHAVTVANVHAVRFNGGNSMTGNFPVEPTIAGTQTMTLEIWFRTEQGASHDAVILGWQSRDGRETSAPVRIPDQCGQSSTWRHLVINCTPTAETWYLDGRKVSSGPRSTVIKPGHVMVLGGASAADPSFRGDLAAVRLHDKAMTEEQIAHNFRGGVMLGTEMHNWWRTEPNKWFTVESEHFRHCVDKEEMAKWTPKQRKEFDERIPGMFHLAELVYHTYSERLALRIAVVSRRPEKRGDGIKYRIPIQPCPGSYMGVDDDFGWSCQGAGFINPHELVHGCQTMTGGMFGNFWETHANFPQIFNGIYQTYPVISKECAAFPSNGRVYYHDRLAFEHFASTPGFGPMFISKLWYDGPTANEKSPYPWLAFTEIVPDGWNTLATEWAKMVQRLVTFDFPTYEEAMPGHGNTPHGNDGVPSKESRYAKTLREQAGDIQRYARIIPAPVPMMPGWWRPSKEQAPQQLGWNIIPLKFTAGTVAATLEGYVNPARGGNWRAGFVGVKRDGKPIYGPIFGPGQKLTFEVGGDIRDLYLAVCAVPTKLLPIKMTGDFRSFEQEQFPYRVKFEGCSPATPGQSEFPAEPRGHRHPNGGGFIADSAHADATSFVGPEARVLGNAKVLDRARIEDHAVVVNATVKDDAVVSDYAVIDKDSVVGGHARVRDFASVTGNSTLKDDAKVLEHAVLNSRKTCSGKVTVKGNAHVYGGNQSGTAVIDGYYAKGNDITGGKWFTWSWGKGQNPGESNDDFGGLYANYDFSREHGWMVVDDHGATWGYLGNSPRFVFCPDKRVEHRTLSEEAIQHTVERTPDREVNYTEIMGGYLQPATTGNYTFLIAADDEGALWIGGPGSARPERKICSNPFFAPFRDYGRFPSQKSAPILLQKGWRYPILAMHANTNAMGSLSVAWQKQGSLQPEPIPENCLFTSPTGGTQGVVKRVWTNVGSIEALLKRPDYPTGKAFSMGGKALEFNGQNQFVELPKDVADFHECAYEIDFKWNGKASGERLFEFANSNGDALYLSPLQDGKAVFALRKGGKMDSIQAPAVPPNVWTTIHVILKHGKGILYMNGKKVAENPAMNLTPGDIRATRCTIGGGLNGGYFGGLIESFKVYSDSPEE
jgi:hypothetical protein